jgi:membrane protein implicated in regulation of membrane protease activity
MQWWAWIAVGAILLVLELTLIAADFYLVFLGVAALVIGILTLAGLLTAAWLQWSAFGILAAFSMLTFRRWVYERLRRRLPDMKPGPVGKSVILPAELKPGESCRLEYCGSSWSAVNGGASLIGAGASARIDRVEGLTLVVHGES